MTRKLRVLVVDDSAVDRMLLTHILNSDTRLHVIGLADSGARAIALASRLNPDVIVMDVTMPDMDGLATTARIMQTRPVPIVICTGLHSSDPTISFRAIEAGALALVGKPEGVGHADHAMLARALADTVVLMSEIKLIRRWSRSTGGLPVVARPSRPSAAPARRAARVVGIGASTGGPPVLQTILSRLPPDLPMPLLIVQHIAPGFLPGLASWLQLASGFPVEIARQHDCPRPGRAYLAPDHCHLGLSATGSILLEYGEPVDRLRPAVSHLFRSLAATPFAADVVGVLLTGMGSDGAEELKLLQDRGATTIAQDADSSVVHGMPGEAIRLGGATHVLSPEKIARLLGELARTGNPG